LGAKGPESKVVEVPKKSREGLLTIPEDIGRELWKLQWRKENDRVGVGCAEMGGEAVGDNRGCSKKTYTVPGEGIEEKGTKAPNGKNGRRGVGKKDDISWGENHAGKSCVG